MDFQINGDTLLHAAVRKREIDIAKILVEYGCPVDVQNVSEKILVQFPILADEAES